MTAVWLFEPRSHGRKRRGARARNIWMNCDGDIKGIELACSFTQRTEYSASVAQTGALRVPSSNRSRRRGSIRRPCCFPLSILVFFLVGCVPNKRTKRQVEVAQVKGLCKRPRAGFFFGFIPRGGEWQLVFFDAGGLISRVSAKKSLGVFSSFLVFLCFPPLFPPPAR